MFGEGREQFQPRAPEKKEQRVEVANVVVKETAMDAVCAMRNAESRIRAEQERIEATGTEEERKGLPACERAIGLIRDGVTSINSMRDVREAV